MKTDKTAEKKAFLDILTETLTLTREALHAPNEEVEPGEKVIGVIEDLRLRALFSLRENTLRAAREFAEHLSVNRPTDKKRDRSLLTQAHTLKASLDAANSVFWQGIYQAYPEAADIGVSVGVREGWQLVVFKTPPNPLDQLIRGLSGMGE